MNRRAVHRTGTPALAALRAALPPITRWAAVAACLTVLAGIGLLGLSGWFITATAIAGASLATALVFDVFAPSAGIRLLALGRTASRYAERLWSHEAVLTALTTLRERLFRAWATPAAARALQLEPARLLFRLTSDLDALESVVLRFILPVLAAGAGAVITGLLIGLLTPATGLLACCALLGTGFLISYRLMRGSALTAARRTCLNERLRNAVIDLVSGQTALLMSGQLPAQQQRILTLDRQLAQHDCSLNRLETRAGAVYTAANGIFVAGCLLATAFVLEAERTRLPIVVLCILAMLGAMEPFSGLRRGAVEAGRAILAGRRLSPRLAGPEPAPGHRGSLPAATTPDPHCSRDLLLQLNNVSFRYPGTRRMTLNGVSLQVARGERVALLGTSGAGKTTLLALAAGELEASAGQLHRHPAGLLAQRVDLFRDSLRDNLLLANPAATEAELWQTLERTGLASDIRQRGAGLDTLLGEGGLGLSGGQAKRFAIARLLLQNHTLWLLDEPTESLDEDSAAGVLATLLCTGYDKGWLMATHLYREARLADRLILLKAGAVVSQWRRGQDGYEHLLHSLRGSPATQDSAEKHAFS